jgi:hypothetical protein
MTRAGDRIFFIYLFMLKRNMGIDQVCFLFAFYIYLFLDTSLETILSYKAFASILKEKIILFQYEFGFDHLHSSYDRRG